jgi:DNA-binding beta-propeller fold protein YncE
MLKLSVQTAACIAISLATVASAQTVKTTLNFAQPIAGVAANPATNLIYVVQPSFGGTSDTLTVVSGSTDEIVRNISVPVGAYLLAVNFFTNKIYIASCNTFAASPSCFVTVIDGRDNKVLKQIPITSNEGNGLLGIAVDVLCNRVYVANATDETIDIIDGNRERVIGSIAVPAGSTPTGITVNPFLKRLYVPLGDNEVEIYDTETKSAVSTTTVGSADSFAAVNLITGNVYVTDAVTGPSTIAVLTGSGAVTTTVPVGDTPYGLDVDPFTNRIYIASTALNVVTAVNGKTNAVTATVTNVPAAFVAVNYVTEKVYVTGGNSLTVLTEK